MFPKWSTMIWFSSHTINSNQTKWFIEYATHRPFLMANKNLFFENKNLFFENKNLFFENKNLFFENKNIMDTIKHSSLTETVRHWWSMNNPLALENEPWDKRRTSLSPASFDPFPLSSRWRHDLSARRGWNVGRLPQPDWTPLTSTTCRKMENIVLKDIEWISALTWSGEYFSCHKLWHSLMWDLNVCLSRKLHWLLPVIMQPTDKVNNAFRLTMCR